ncbi:MAG: hypothetical protein GEU80_08920 [Dehalococcoidia bacterium]|nr:hypothetical protein [Dehalococcoidia bacterium]
MIATQDGRSKAWRFVYGRPECPVEGRTCASCRARLTHWHVEHGRRAQYLFITQPNVVETARAMYEQSGLTA